MKKLLLLLFILVSFGTMLEAQRRYLDPIYTQAQIRRTDSVRYALNKSLDAFYFLGAPKSRLQPMLTDIYQPPTTDTTTKRPLVIYLHTGNFLPVNAVSPGGGIKDSTAVEICTRFARMGYVSVSADYRIGWNPNLVQEEARRLTLINASYRGIQDVRSCIRFFKANAATYGIDTGKIIVFGQGTGGYLSLGAATLDNFAKIANTSYGPNKFFYGGTTMIQPAVNGDIYGTTFGIVPATSTDTFTRPGDTLCLPNLPTVSSDFQMQVNLGGALGDLTWIDASSKPSISFQAPYDPFAPYIDGVLFVGTASNPQPVIRVQGADKVQRKNDTLGINNLFKTLTAANDPYKAIFTARTSNYVTGLFPLLGDAVPGDSSPWDFWESTNPRNNQGLATNPNMSAAKARRYIDTIMQVVLPRACIALNLPCKGFVTSTEDLLQTSTTKLIVSPNPAQSAINFESEVYNPIQSIELFDLSGRSINYVKNVNSSFYQLNRGSIPNGMYIAKVKFEGGILSKKIVFDGK